MNNYFSIMIHTYVSMIVPGIILSPQIIDNLSATFFVITYIILLFITYVILIWMRYHYNKIEKFHRNELPINLNVHDQEITMIGTVSDKQLEKNEYVQLLYEISPGLCYTKTAFIIFNFIISSFFCTKILEVLLCNLFSFNVANGYISTILIASIIIRGNVSHILEKFSILVFLIFGIVLSLWSFYIYRFRAFSFVDSYFLVTNFSGGISKIFFSFGIFLFLKNFFIFRDFPDSKTLSSVVIGVVAGLLSVCYIGYFSVNLAGSYIKNNGILDFFLLDKDSLWNIFEKRVEGRLYVSIVLMKYIFIVFISFYMFFNLKCCSKSARIALTEVFRTKKMDFKLKYMFRLFIEIFLNFIVWLLFMNLNGFSLIWIAEFIGGTVINFLTIFIPCFSCFIFNYNTKGIKYYRTIISIILSGSSLVYFFYIFCVKIFIDDISEISEFKNLKEKIVIIT